jgi:hypothetical protein
MQPFSPFFLFLSHATSTVHASLGMISTAGTATSIENA